MWLTSASRPGRRRALVLAAIALAALALVGCTSDGGNSSGNSDGASDGGGADTGRAPGLWDKGDGTSEAIGMLQWIDLEGGFWAIVDNTADGDGTVVVVIQNADEFTDTIASLKGRMVIATGTIHEGPSIRMAGPEMIADSIEAFDAPAGAAE